MTGGGLCSLWPEVLTVEPGTPACRYRLNGTLYMNLVTPEGDPLYSTLMNMECLYIRGRCSVTLEEVIDRFKLLLEETSLQNLTALRRSFRTLQTQLERKAVSRASSVLTKKTD